MPATALNEASDFAFGTSAPIVADHIKQASQETGVSRRIRVLARPWRAGIGRELFVMGYVAHDIFPWIRQALSCPTPTAPSLEPAAAGLDVSEPGAPRFAKCALSTGSDPAPGRRSCCRRRSRRRLRRPRR